MRSSRRGRGDELDAAQLRPLARGEVGDDHARRARGPRLGGEAVPAVGLEQRRVRHRDERHVRRGARLGEAFEARVGAHPLREGALGGAADHGPVGERVGEREAELDMSAPAFDRRLGELGRLRAAIR